MDPKNLLSFTHTNCREYVNVTRHEAEDIFSTCSAIVKVLGGDIREKCRNRGMPEELIEEFVQKDSRKDTYDDFFKVHTDSGEIKLSEREMVEKLRVFGIEAGVDPHGNKWIRMPKGKLANSIEMRLCVSLRDKYGYKYM